MAMQAKLHHIDHHHQLFTPDVKTVVDLGFAPGNWSQYTKNRMCQVHDLDPEKFTTKCHLLGVDLLFATPPVKGMSVLQGNIFSKMTQNLIHRHLATFGVTADVVLCDLAMPLMQMTGFYSTTFSRPYMKLTTNKALQKPMTDVNMAAVTMAQASVALMVRVLRQGGKFVCRLSRTTEPPPVEFHDQLEELFGEVHYHVDGNDHVFVCLEKVDPAAPSPEPLARAKL